MKISILFLILLNIGFITASGQGSVITGIPPGQREEYLIRKNSEEARKHLDNLDDLANRNNPKNKPSDYSGVRYLITKDRYRNSFSDELVLLALADEYRKKFAGFLSRKN